MATKLSLVIDQGTTFYSTVQILDDAGTPIDFTGYTGTAQMRKHYTSSNSVSFTVNATSNGIVSLALNSNVTANLVAGRYVYDVELTAPANTTSRVVEGIITVTPQVTR
jgi:hypothetical protein